MKMTRGKFTIAGLVALSSLFMSVSARALEPQTLFNFRLSPGQVTGALIQGPDGNFYGTTSQGGPTGNGTVFRVTPAGVLTTLVSDQANPVAGLFKDGFRASIADGSVRFVKKSVDPKALWALFTRASGDSVDRAK